MKIIATALALTTGALVVSSCELVPQTCVSATGLAFIEKPVAVRNRLNKITWRESRNVPTARRAGSQYYGCFQIGVRTHAARIKRLGFSAADMLRAWPNAVVARSLFDSSGWSPWAATA